MSRNAWLDFTPFSIIQTRPARSHTYMRPSAAKVSPAASFQVPPMACSVKFAGKVPACDRWLLRAHASTNAAVSLKILVIIFLVDLLAYRPLPFISGSSIPAHVCLESYVDRELVKQLDNSTAI